MESCFVHRRTSNFLGSYAVALFVLSQLPSAHLTTFYFFAAPAALFRSHSKRKTALEIDGR